MSKRLDSDKIELVKSLLKKGLTHKRISEITNISQSEVGAISRQEVSVYRLIKEHAINEFTREIYNCPEHGKVFKTKNFGPCLACYSERYRNLAKLKY